MKRKSDFPNLPTIDENIKELDRIKIELEAYLVLLVSRLGDIRKEAYHCYSCDTYFPRTEIQTTTHTKLYKDVCIYSDAGYGDTDQYADEEYLISYKVCPNCGAEQEHNRYLTATFNVRNKNW